MKVDRILRDLFLLLIVIYFAQGALYTRGSIISQISLVLILIISVFYFYKTLIRKSHSSNYYKLLTLFIILNVLGAVFTADFAQPFVFGQLKNIMFVSLSFFPAYYLTQNFILKEKHLIRFLLLMIPVAVLSFYHLESVIIYETNRTEGNIVNNTAYLFVFIMPFVFFVRSKLMSIILIFILIFFIIHGAKRGALLAGALGVVLFVYYQLINTKKSKRYKSVFWIIISIIIIAFFFNDFYQNNTFLINRVESITMDDGSSGRDRIYSNILNSWLNSDGFFNLIFGFGFAGSTLLSGSGHFAHNDWLEMLSNFGLVGFVIYLLMFYSIFKYIYNSKNKRDNYKLALIAVMLTWVVTSMFSMNYSAPNTVFQSILLGYLLASKNK